MGVMGVMGLLCPESHNTITITVSGVHSNNRERDALCMVGHKRERVLGRVGRAVDAAARDFAREAASLRTAVGEKPPPNVSWSSSLKLLRLTNLSLCTQWALARNWYPESLQTLSHMTLPCPPSLPPSPSPPPKRKQFSAQHQPSHKDIQL